MPEGRSSARARICKPFKGHRNRVPCLADLMSRNWFLGSLSVYKYSLWSDSLYGFWFCYYLWHHAWKAGLSQFHFVDRLTIGVLGSTLISSTQNNKDVRVFKGMVSRDRKVLGWMVYTVHSAWAANRKSVFMSTYAFLVGSKNSFTVQLICSVFRLFSAMTLRQF